MLKEEMDIDMDSESLPAYICSGSACCILTVFIGGSAYGIYRYMEAYNKFKQDDSN